MSLVTWIIALVSAETAAFLPVSGGFIRHVTLFTNEALGSTCGYVFTYLLAITAPAEVRPFTNERYRRTTWLTDFVLQVTAATSLISFWRPDLSPVSLHLHSPTRLLPRAGRYWPLEAEEELGLAPANSSLRLLD